ncbi:Protein ALP1-like isoform X2 [Camponotus japonicus]
MFFRYTRMTVNTFYNLLELIAPALQKSHWRAISPEQRLSITLRYLATGDQVLSIAFAYRVGESTAYAIIKETTEAIVNILLPQFVQPPSMEDYKKISAGFLEKWNFSNCLGALDGKHCFYKSSLTIWQFILQL